MERSRRWWNEKGMIPSLQILSCVVLGMISSLLIGYANALTVMATAMLVLYTERGYANSLSCIKDRIKLQCVVGIMISTAIYLFRYILNIQIWLADSLALLIVTGIGLVLHDRGILGPLNVSVSITAVIMLMGTVKNPAYPAIRVGYCMTGCVLAAVITAVSLKLQNRGKRVPDRVSVVTNALVAGEVYIDDIRSYHQESELRIQALEKDLSWERRHLSVERYHWLRKQHRMNEVLLRIEECLCKIDQANMQEPLLNLYQQVCSLHRALFCETSGNESGGDKTSEYPGIVVTNEQEAALANELFTYLRIVNEGIGGKGEAVGY